MSIKLVVASGIFLLLFLLLPSKTLANSRFSVSVDTTYSVSDTGLTHVLVNGTVTNTTDVYYAANYIIQFGFSDIEHIHASDRNGMIQPQVKKTSGGNAITIPFHAIAYGKDKQTSFTFSFDTTDVAKRVGTIWEINIPGIGDQTEFSDFNVHVQVPQSFGSPAYSKPIITGNSLDYDKNSLGSSGVSLAFGTTQVYNYSLQYEIKNSYLFPITTEIALPPSTNYQEVTLDDINPKPDSIALDADGNWLATYYLYPSQKITAIAKGSVFVSLHPKQEKLSNQQKRIYTLEQPFWQVADPSLQKLARDLKTPENIYAYVVHHLHYDFTRIAGEQQRVGAINVLNDPSSAVCLEFTDLFITLVRAAGIPARAVEGYAYTENKQQRPLFLEKDVLHEWPEFYDAQQQTWIMVDPTWENTTKGIDYFHTLDFDHVAFILKGTSSTYPIPPGGYKFSADETSKDVFVTFGKQLSLQDPQVTWSFDIPPVLFSGFPITGNLTFKNISDRLVPPEIVKVSTPYLLPHTQTIYSQPIPPFTSAVLPVKLQATSFLTNAKEVITIRVAGNTITKTISVYPFFYNKNYLIGSIISVIFCIGLFIVATRSRRLSFFRRKR